MKSESKTASSPRRTWTPPRVTETADLGRIIAGGVATGKTVNTMDGQSQESMPPMP